MRCPLERRSSIQSALYGDPYYNPRGWGIERGRVCAQAFDDLQALRPLQATPRHTYQALAQWTRGPEFKSRRPDWKSPAEAGFFVV